MRRTAPDAGEIVAGKYQIKELLGRGGMGEVYLARHTITGKRVAIKMLSSGISATAQADKRLVREAIASGCIEHRHVVNVFDIGEHQGSVFLVMEYLEGKSFKQLMTERSSSDRELLEILLRAMEGVRAAHAQGVIHRDLKPDNILVCLGPTGHYDDPKVVDFGICRLVAEAGVTDLTQIGVTVGSPFYMSLEQLQGARDLDGRADLYAIGVILYQALTQRRPFEAQTLGELTGKISSGVPPTAFAELRPDLPRGLSRVVMRALSRERDKRQPDVATLIRELTPFVAQLQETPPSTSALPIAITVTQSADTPLPIWNSERVQRARPWLQLAAAAMMAFAFTLGGISFLRSLMRPEEIAVSASVAASAPEPILVPPAPPITSAMAEEPSEPPSEAVAVEVRAVPKAMPRKRIWNARGKRRPRVIAPARATVPTPNPAKVQAIDVNDPYR